MLNGKEGVTPLPRPSRLCEDCERPIPAKRLTAVPNAILCVPCLERSGDVARLRRLDEYIGKEGEEVVETYFTNNPYLKDAIRKGFGSTVVLDPVPMEEAIA
jgi:hypothetical protein